MNIPGVGGTGATGLGSIGSGGAVEGGADGGGFSQLLDGLSHSSRSSTFPRCRRTR